MPSLTEAIERKYHSSEDSETEAIEGVSFRIFAPKVGPAGCVPSILVLNACKIDSIGDEEKLVQFCAKVEEIDLSHNDIKFKDLQTLTKHVPRWKFANLSFNHFGTGQQGQVQELSDSGFIANKLETLVLIGTGIEWPAFWTLMQASPCLKEVHLSLNNFSEVILPSEAKGQGSLEDHGQGHQYSTVERMKFDNNPVSSWKEVGKLGKAFPSLKYLSLAECPLSFKTEKEDFKERFGNLENLNLSSTLMETEGEIRWLNEFPKLREVRLTGIKFMADAEAKSKRQELIALLPNIRVLNGGAQILEDERDAAERHYIRKYMDREEQERSERHNELTQKHGKLEPLVDLNLKPVTKVRLRLKFGKEEVERLVNVKQTVGEFKKSLEPIFGLPPSRMVLYLDLQDGQGPEILNFPNRKLYAHKVSEGNLIYVEIKNNSRREIN